LLLPSRKNKTKITVGCGEEEVYFLMMMNDINLLREMIREVVAEAVEPLIVRLDQVETRLGTMETRLGTMDTRLTDMNLRFEIMYVLFTDLQYLIFLTH